MTLKFTKIVPFGVLIESDASTSHIHDLDIEVLRELFKKEHLIVLRGFRTFNKPADFANYCERWGEILVWPFGKVLELFEHENPADHIFDHSYIPLHWDGMYLPHVPEYQIFHCVKAPHHSQGGRTTFSNTISTLKSASPTITNLWHRAFGIYQRKMDFYDSKTMSPIITKHPYRSFSVIRYNEPPVHGDKNFVNPPQLVFTGIDAQEEAILHQSLRDALYAENNFYAHEWQEHDVIIADNFSLLHGREEFVSKAHRHLERVHVHSNPPCANSGLESYR